MATIRISEELTRVAVLYILVISILLIVIFFCCCCILTLRYSYVIGELYHTLFSGVLENNSPLINMCSLEHNPSNFSNLYDNFRFSSRLSKMIGSFANMRFHFDRKTKITAISSTRCKSFWQKTFVALQCKNSWNCPSFKPQLF